MFYRAEIIEAEKQKKDVRSIVLPSRALNSSNSSPGKQSSSSSVPEKAKRYSLFLRRA